jgi:hypothetical protein
MSDKVLFHPTLAMETAQPRQVRKQIVMNQRICIFLEGLLAIPHFEKK